MNFKKIILAVGIFLTVSNFLSAQNFFDQSYVNGSFQTDGQLYLSDKAMGITDSILKGNRYGMNTFGELNYSVNNFRAGMRFEAYTPPLKGFDTKAKGLGIPYFYASYSNKYIDVTLGDFYEQFGAGFALRSYQEWNLGYDNAIRGAKVSVMPYKGIKVTGLTGYQRWFWDTKDNWLGNNNKGLVTGFDGNFFINDIFDLEIDPQFTLGGSFVTKNEKDLSKTVIFNDTLQKLNLPDNVATSAARFNLSWGGFSLYSEYAYKINNPSAYNNYIYRPGRALFINTSYSMKGFGVSLAAKRVDNMSFKSKMDATDNALDINFIPPLTKQHLYSLPSIYPYASQLNGEMSLKGNVIYTIPKKTKIGGRYGMSIEADFSIVYDIDRQPIAEGIPINQPGTKGYESSFFKLGENRLFTDFNLTITKKFNKNWKGIFSYIYLYYDKDRVESHPIGEFGIVNAHTGIADVTWKINSKNSLRMETQFLFTKDRADKGHWATMLLEYSIAPNWFFSISDEYNFGNKNEADRLHYYNFSAGYVYRASRFSVSWGRQREGLLCIGGVCRYVPASTGISFSVSTSF